MKRPWLIGIGATVLITGVLEIVYRHYAHPHFWWQATPIFDLVYGVAGCAVIVVVSKWLGHTWLQRDEAYYGDEEL